MPVMVVVEGGLIYDVMTYFPTTGMLRCSVMEVLMQMCVCVLYEGYDTRSNFDATELNPLPWITQRFIKLHVSHQSTQFIRARGKFIHHNGNLLGQFL